jgi:pimeloyl-ACP methyl ester carboxylesterase
VRSGRAARAAVLLLLLLVAAGCGGDGTASPDQRARSLVHAQVNEVERVLADTTVTMLVWVPNGWTPGSAPVVLAFPPGGQDRALTASLLEETYVPQAEARGWAVVSPVGPAGGLWFDAPATLVQALVDEVTRLLLPEGGVPLHLVGVSNGGLSAFHAFAIAPDAFASVVVFPGYARTDDRQSAVLDRLAAIPVRLFVGGDDPAWREPMEELATELADHGGDVRLEVLAGEGHIIASLRDGERLFDAMAGG